MSSGTVNPTWGKETAIKFALQGTHEDANFLYKVTAPLSDVEMRALIASGLIVGTSVDKKDIDPGGDSVTEPFAMEGYVTDENGKLVAASSILRLSGRSQAALRVRDLYKISGALTVMRNPPIPIEIVFDEEAHAVADA